MDKSKISNELNITNKENIKLAAELVIAEAEKKDRADELVIINKELSIQIKENLKKTEEVKKANERFELAMKASQEGLYDWNLVTNEVYYSPKWKMMLGYTDDELPNDLSIWEKLVLPDDGKRIQKLHEEKLNGVKKEKHFDLEFKMKHKDGHWVDIYSRAITEFNEQGNAIRLVGTHLDISVKKLAEKELVLAKEKAEQSDKLKSAFLANMSHEIRTPMNGILGFSELLKTPNLSGDQQQNYIGIIEKSGKRMLNIINDIVDISKIEAGLMKLDIKESNINEQIEYIYTFFKPEVEAKGMQLFFKNTLLAKETTIKTDREKLFAILTNLIKNAIKYSNEGSIEIGYVLKKGSELTNQSQKTELEFYVKDTGVGIPKNRQVAIFERFIQLDTEDKAIQGAGLGLAITKAYIEILGGKIWVESEEGIGSTFYFTLPYSVELKEDNSTKEIEVADNIENHIKKLKVLIAEDDETSEMLLSINVSEFSNEILTASTGTEVVEICRNNPDIDLILMDIQMPEMNGHEATRQIRKFNKDVVIIAQTAYGLTGDREKSLDAGCNDYITKPINKLELDSLIEKHNY